MTVATSRVAAAPVKPGRLQRRNRYVGVLFVAPYLLFLLFFGIAPAVYAVGLAFTSQTAWTFEGVGNVERVVRDFRFLPAAGHVALYLLVWLVALVVLVVVLAVMVHGIGRRWISGTVRMLYYIPGALAGASSVLLWLFMLNPVASPVGPLLRSMGYTSFNSTIQPSHLPIVFAIIAFWTGAGGWIIVMYGALNNIPTEVLEAARIDGADAIQIAWRIEIPMLRRWISYMAVLSLAAGTQLFVEPTLLSQASNAVVPNDYSLNQLAYQYAFNLGDFNGAAAISVLLLVVALALSALFVQRGGLFDTEDQ